MQTQESDGESCRALFVSAGRPQQALYYGNVGFLTFSALRVGIHAIWHVLRRDRNALAVTWLRVGLWLLWRRLVDRQDPVQRIEQRGVRHDRRLGLRCLR